MSSELLIFAKSTAVDPYHLECVRGLGYTVAVQPVVITESLLTPQTAQALREALCSKKYSAVVFTSKYAVKLVSELFSSNFPRTIPVFAQSNGTATAVEQLLNVSALLPGGKHVSESLASFVNANVAKGSMVCFPAAQQTSGGFLERAHELELQVEHWPLYKTSALPLNPSEVDGWHQRYQRVYFIVYSPSAVSSIVKSYGAAKASLSACRFISIGPKTSRALRSASLEVALEASQPNDGAIVECIEQLPGI